MFDIGIGYIWCKSLFQTSTKSFKSIWTQNSCVMPKVSSLLDWIEIIGYVQAIVHSSTLSLLDKHSASRICIKSFSLFLQHNFYMTYISSLSLYLNILYLLWCTYESVLLLTCNQISFEYVRVCIYFTVSWQKTKTKPTYWTF